MRLIDEGSTGVRAAMSTAVHRCNSEQTLKIRYSLVPRENWARLSAQCRSIAEAKSHMQMGLILEVGNRREL